MEDSDLQCGNHTSCPVLAGSHCIPIILIFQTGREQGAGEQSL